MDTSIPADTHIVGTHEGTGRHGYHIYPTGRKRVLYYPCPWVPIDIPREDFGSFNCWKFLATMNLNYGTSVRALAGAEAGI